LLTPFTAMLFMGEEWAASTPFQFFTSHPDPEIAEATRRGRRAEFAGHGWAGEVPDPQDPQTFARSKLRWDEPVIGRHARVHRLYRELIALRRNEPDLADFWLDHMAVEFDEEHKWIVLRRGGLAIACNLGARTAVVPVTGQVVLAWETPHTEAKETTLAGHSFAVLRT
jgi:maltooligosyltrehalose trehalohydrolase